MLKEQLKAYQTSSNRSIDSINFFSDDISNDLPNGNSNYGVRPDTAQSDNRSIRSSLTQAVIGGQYDRYPQNISNEGFKRNISQISIDSNTSNSMKPVVDRDSISRENYNSIRQPVKQLSDTRNVIAQSPSINQWLNESPRNNNAAVLSNQTTSNSKAIIETDVLRQLQNTSRNAIPNQLSSSITNQNLSQPQMNRTTRLPSPSNPQTFHHQSGGLNSPSNPRSPMIGIMELLSDLFGDDTIDETTTDVKLPKDDGLAISAISKMTKPPSPRSNYGFMGLSNQGATCYLNSLLQSMYMTPELREGIFSLDPDELGVNIKIELANDNTIEPDETLLNQLVSMGVSENKAKKSLVATNNTGLLQAMDYIDKNLQSDEVDISEIYIEPIDKKKKVKPRLIPLELQSLFTKMRLADVETISTHDLTSKGFKWQDLDGRVQHDAHELNRLLIDALEKSLKKTTGETLCKDIYQGADSELVKEFNDEGLGLCLDCILDFASINHTDNGIERVLSLRLEYGEITIPGRANIPSLSRPIELLEEPKEEPNEEDEVMIIDSVYEENKQILTEINELRSNNYQYIQDSFGYTDKIPDSHEYLLLREVQSDKLPRKSFWLYDSNQSVPVTTKPNQADTLQAISSIGVKRQSPNNKQT
eukprot:gene21140-27392_t